MRKVFFTVLVLMLASGWWLPSESRALQKHPSIQACEDVIQAMLKAPSTYQLKKATMLVIKGTEKPSIIVEYDAQNSLGVPITSQAMCIFDIEKSGDYYNYIKRMVKENGEARPLSRSPFDELSLVRVSIDGEYVPEQVVHAANSDMIMKYRLQYKGPNGIGRIERYTDADTFECAETCSKEYRGGSSWERLKNKYLGD